jgi:hypothetical protein
MLEWVWRASEQVQQLANNDPEYQQLARRRMELEPGFQTLLDKLTEEDREALLDYMEAESDLHYRYSQLAWLYGRQHP